MENFISVSIPGRKAKKAIMDKMISSASEHLQESEPNYGIFESDDQNIILKLEIPNQLNAMESDVVAHNLSENMFNLGYNDFDIEISSDPQDENTLENTDWHSVNEAPIALKQISSNGSLVNFNIDKSLPSIEVQSPSGVKARIHGTPAQLKTYQAKITQQGGKVITPMKAKGGVQGATFKKDGSIDTGGDKKPDTKPKGQPGVGPEPGSKDALMAIVNQYAKPGITLADVDAMERAAIASETKSAADDANIVSKAFQGFKRFARNKDWRVKFVLANAAEKMQLPGLFNSKGNFIYMAEQTQDDEGGGFDAGGPSSAAGTSLKSYMILAKVGLVPDSKLEKIQKAFANRPDDMKEVNAIVAAQKAATSGKIKGDLSGDGKTDAERSSGAGNKSGIDAGTDANKFADLSSKEASQLLFDKLKQLRELMRNNPEPRGAVAENKKILMRRLHNNYIFEDVAADKAIAELVADIELLIPKVSDANARIANDALRKASPYVRRHKAVASASGKSKADKKTSRLNVPGNPLADFSKSGKGGLANDPDEQLAIDELQRYLGIPVTGKYDQTTRDAVSAYQKRNKLKVDGDAGPETIGHMMGNDNPKKYTPPAQGQDNNPNKDGGQKSDADQRKADAKKDLRNGVAPPEEQKLEDAIKFNWKGTSYYVSVTKVEKNEANNNIAWVFFKDEKLQQGQKVAVLGSHWEAQLEKELKRRAEAGSKKAKDALEIINPEGSDPSNQAAQTGGDKVVAVYKEVKGSGQGRRYVTYDKDGNEVSKGRGGGPSNLPTKAEYDKRVAAGSQTTDSKPADSSTSTDKKPDDTSTDDVGSEEDPDDTTADDEKPATFSKNQNDYMNKLATKIFDAGDRLGTDEEAIGDALSKIKTPAQYAQVDKFFKALDKNDKNTDLRRYIGSEINLKNQDGDDYYWSHLRRIKVPHTLPSNYIGRKTSRGIRGGSYTFRTYGEMYDDKGKFIIKKAK
tara:strand:+ start:8909 stop:11818 length:2910 start_codon:yes stop_codon:yes gene_type:complete